MATRNPVGCADAGGASYGIDSRGDLCLVRFTAFSTPYESFLFRVKERVSWVRGQFVFFGEFLGQSE
jgi:hypothetical protein